jgi:hypothetical protein
MGKIKEDKVREQRITDEITADAYDAEERIMGWQTYLENTLNFPFEGRCIREIVISPLKKGEKVRALAMADSDLYRNNMFVIVEWQNRQFGVPLEQIVPLDSDEETTEAVKDWHYWVEKGYRF